MCAKIGSYCCTFIPNNTAPTGNFTLAMKKLFRLRHELADHSGPASFNSALSEWFKIYFGSPWGGWLASVLGVIGLILLIFCLVMCCALPWVKSLAVRAIASRFTQMIVMIGKDSDGIDLEMSYDDDEALEMIQVLCDEGQNESGGEPDSNGDMWELGDQTT